jgi:hypothetical protein
MTLTNTAPVPPETYKHSPFLQTQPLFYMKLPNTAPFLRNIALLRNLQTQPLFYMKLTNTAPFFTNIALLRNLQTQPLFHQKRTNTALLYMKLPNTALLTNTAPFPPETYKHSPFFNNTAPSLHETNKHSPLLLRN